MEDRPFYIQLNGLSENGDWNGSGLLPPIPRLLGGLGGAVVIITREIE